MLLPDPVHRVHKGAVLRPLFGSLIAPERGLDRRGDLAGPRRDEEPRRPGRGTGQEGRRRRAPRHGAGHHGDAQQHDPEGDERRDHGGRRPTAGPTQGQVGAADAGQQARRQIPEGHQATGQLGQCLLELPPADQPVGQDDDGQAADHGSADQHERHRMAPRHGAHDTRCRQCHEQQFGPGRQGEEEVEPAAGQRVRQRVDLGLVPAEGEGPEASDQGRQHQDGSGPAEGTPAELTAVGGDEHGPGQHQHHPDDGVAQRGERGDQGGERPPPPGAQHHVEQAEGDQGEDECQSVAELADHRRQQVSAVLVVRVVEQERQHADRHRHRDRRRQPAHPAERPRGQRERQRDGRHDQLDRRAVGQDEVHGEDGQGRDRHVELVDGEPSNHWGDRRSGAVAPAAAAGSARLRDRRGHHRWAATTRRAGSAAAARTRRWSRPPGRPGSATPGPRPAGSRRACWARSACASWGVLRDGLGRCACVGRRVDFTGGCTFCAGVCLCAGVCVFFPAGDPLRR